MKEHPLLLTGPNVRSTLADLKTQTRRIITRHNSTFDGGQWPAWAGNSAFDWAKAVSDQSCMMTGQPCLRLPWPAEETIHRIWPKWEMGEDRIYIRETWRPVQSGQITDGQGNIRYGVTYRADNTVRWDKHTTKIQVLGDGGVITPSNGGFIVHGHSKQCDTERPLQFQEGKARWSPAIHMRHADCRLFLDVLRVWPERLQDISEEDARAEGVREFLKEPAPGYSWQNGGPCYGTAKAAFAALWNSINAKPKPARIRKGKPSIYFSAPWSEADRDPREVIGGLPHVCIPNPWVWAIKYKRVKESEVTGE